MARGVNHENAVSMYLSGKSIPQVADALGMSRSTVRLAAFNAGVLRTRSEGISAAGSDGRLGSGMRGKKRQFSAGHCAAIKASAIERGERTAKGLSRKPNGYIEITRGPNKGKLQHRVIMEEATGRALLSNEVVHHRDHTRDNNDPSNLGVMSRSAHTSHHRKESRQCAE